MADDTDAAATIAAESRKDVAAIEAVQASNTEEASNFITTLDKLQEFKRYTLALAVIFIWGGVIAVMALAVAVLVYKGQYDVAIEALKWLITVVGISVASIIGFYFGSNQQGNNAG